MNRQRYPLPWPHIRSPGNDNCNSNSEDHMRKSGSEGTAALFCTQYKVTSQLSWPHNIKLKFGCQEKITFLQRTLSIMGYFKAVVRIIENPFYYQLRKGPWLESMHSFQCSHPFSRRRMSGIEPYINRMGSQIRQIIRCHAL